MKLCGIDTVSRKEGVSYYSEWHYYMTERGVDERRPVSTRMWIREACLGPLILASFSMS